MSILKITLLFLGVWFTLINICLCVFKDHIPAINMIIQAIGIVGFIIMQFNLL